MGTERPQQIGLEGTRKPVINRRRGRPITPKNIGDRFTSTEREAEMNRWWDNDMALHFAQGAQDYIIAQGARIAARAGVNVELIGAELRQLDCSVGIIEAVKRTKGLAITPEEIAQRVIRESRALERQAQIRFANGYSIFVIDLVADAKKLSKERHSQMKAFVHQRSLPRF